jgi:hypothetical protein
LAAQNKQRAGERKPAGREFFKRRQPLVLKRGESCTPAVTPEQARHQRDRTDALDLAGRLAIEQALEHRELMSREAGGWC